MRDHAITVSMHAPVLVCAQPFRPGRVPLESDQVVEPPLLTRSIMEQLLCSSPLGSEMISIHHPTMSVHGNGPRATIADIGNDSLNE